MRAGTGQWFEPRPVRATTAPFCSFDDGAPCTIMHNGYGYFVASKSVPWGGTKVIHTTEERVEIRKTMRQ